ncbi:hypothetical protein DID88_007944 [Monilinia fructigena]|uniref:Uncharacterized protein n=1 Tax=Monilinia fructigena TaxID=38457 RepID=A0A395J4F8_9HELO|nr:hypothetical protein DID88_007944 [Monilinia fructigena]
MDRPSVPPIIINGISGIPPLPLLSLRELQPVTTLLNSYLKSSFKPPREISRHFHVTLEQAPVTLVVEKVVLLRLYGSNEIDRKAGKASPWWTDECREAHRAHIAAQRGTDSERKTNATHLLQRVVRQAKRSYWAMRLDGVKDDKELYRIMGWHKLTPESNAKSPSLIIGEREICDTREKAEALFTAVLDRFKADDDLPNDPLRNQVHKGPSPGKERSRLKVEKHVIGASCTAPGVDRATVRLLKACWPSVKSLIREILHRV